MAHPRYRVFPRPCAMRRRAKVGPATLARARAAMAVAALLWIGPLLAAAVFAWGVIK